MSQFQSDADVMQWLFDLEKITQAFNWPVGVQRLINAKRDMCKLIAAKAPASDVAEVYRAFSGALGPTAMTLLLESDDAFDEVNHSGKPTPPSPGKVTLYVDQQGKRVLAEFFKEFGKQPTFTVE